MSAGLVYVLEDALGDLSPGLSDEWATPQSLFERLHQEFKFDIDIAASDSNHKIDNYFTKEDNALHPDAHWDACGKVAWLNPPYTKAGGPIRKWMEAARAWAERGMCVVCLVPGHTADGWYQDVVLHRSVPPFAEDVFKGSYVRVVDDMLAFSWQQALVEHEVRIIPGRLKFTSPGVKSTTARFPSHLVIFDGR